MNNNSMQTLSEKLRDKSREDAELMSKNSADALKKHSENLAKLSSEYQALTQKSMRELSQQLVQEHQNLNSRLTPLLLRPIYITTALVLSMLLATWGVTQYQIDQILNNQAIIESNKQELMKQGEQYRAVKADLEQMKQHLQQETKRKK